MIPRLQTAKVYRKEFTLTELLVVIAIFLILASVLMPSLSKAMDRAKLITCQKNYKQLYVGLMIYTDDFDGWVPGGVGAEEGTAFNGRVMGDNEDDRPMMSFSALFEAGSLDDEALKSTICPTYEAGHDEQSYKWIVNRMIPLVDQGVSFEYLEKSYDDGHYLGYTVAYGVQNAIRINDLDFRKQPVIMMDIMSNIDGTNKMGKTHNFEKNNFLYIDGHVKTFDIGYLDSIYKTYSSIENFRYNSNIWKDTEILD